MSPIRRLDAKELAALPKDALILDVREPGEFAGLRWPGSVNAPLSRLDAEAARLPRERVVVVLCRSGRRSEEAARRLEALGFPEVRVVAGGLSACEGGCLEQGPGGVWPMERQVRLAAGSLVLAGAALGSLVHPGFWWLSAAIGAGLVYSAVTDTCGMAAALARMPWNRGCR
jgi:rhodanese-related sulfurtransferase